MGIMEQPAILSEATVSKCDKQKSSSSAPLSDELAANVKNISPEQNQDNQLSDTVAETLRPVDRFFSQQARGDVLSPIKRKPYEEGISMESLELKLDDTYVINRKLNADCVQPESFPTENLDLLDVNILESRSESEHIETTKVSHPQNSDNSGKSSIDEVAQTDTSKEVPVARKRPQTEMEPAIFDIPRLSKHPHTDCPPVPEFRDDFEPLIQFSSETENIFCVSLDESKLSDESVEQMSVQEASQVSTRPTESTARGETTNEHVSDKLSADNSDSENVLRTDLNDSARAASGDTENLQLPLYWFLESLDSVFEPIVGTLLPGVHRKVGFNTAIVCLPLLAASIYLFYL